MPRGSALVALCLVSAGGAAAHGYSLAAFFAYMYGGFLAVDMHWETNLDHTGTMVGVLVTVISRPRESPYNSCGALPMDRFGMCPTTYLLPICPETRKFH